MVLLIITDLHEDLAYSSQKLDVVNGQGQSSINMLSHFDSAFVLSSIFPFFPSIHTMEKKNDSENEKIGHVNVPEWNLLLEQINFHILLERSGYIKIVRQKKDLQFHGVKLLLALEGTDALRFPEDVFLLYSLGLRSLGISWNYDNKFGSSYLSKKDYGLTGSGCVLVSYCKELGIALDLSHASKKTIEDVLSLPHGPLFISHGNSDAVFHHPRNYPDSILSSIFAEGGIIGITGIRSTLGFDQDLEAIKHHITYIGETFGWEHVALGSDFLGVDEPVKGFENVLKFKDLRSELKEQDDLVLWKNGLNFFNKVLK